MAEFDYRRQAYELAGKGYEEHVNTAVKALHYNESLHMHNLGVEKKQHGACEYFWLRAGRTVRALAEGGLVAPFYEGQLVDDTAGSAT